jgi:hypothetical protein
MKLLERVSKLETDMPVQPMVNIRQLKNFSNGDFTGEYSIEWIASDSGKPIKSIKTDLAGVRAWLKQNGIKHPHIDFSTLDVWINVENGGNRYHNNQFRGVADLLKSIQEKYDAFGLHFWDNLPAEARREFNSQYEKITGLKR